MAVPQRNNTNLAYDLSRFDTAAREERERQRADEERQRRQIRIAPHSVSKTGSIFGHDSSVCGAVRCKLVQHI